MRNMKMLEYGLLASRATQIAIDLRQLSERVRTPSRVIDLSAGDLHTGGLKPLTFIRQVLAACIHPQLINSNKLPSDARLRAQRLLGMCNGGTIGSYTATAGISEIVQRVSEFITRRDGGVPSNPENIIISPGSQWSIVNILEVLMNGEGSLRSGVLVPVPGHVTTTVSLQALGGVVVPYFLNEEQGWSLQVDELQRALESAKGACNPVALYVINPGNPAGYVQSRKSIKEVIQFASEKRLFLLADEVYQDCVHKDSNEFVSYKRVLKEMGHPYSDNVELASFHSASKGTVGECGLRSGYVELVNLDPNVMNYIHTLFSKDSCAPVLGQLAMDLMTHPPQPGDPSYPLFIQETKHIKTTLVQNIRRAHEVLNSLPGFSSQDVQGGAFMFPRVLLPPKAIQKAKEVGLKPDIFYCKKLLEEAELLFVPGCIYGQKKGTYHIRYTTNNLSMILKTMSYFVLYCFSTLYSKLQNFLDRRIQLLPYLILFCVYRFCFLTPHDIMEEILTRLSVFHRRFMEDFS
ncbi:LOW QUALITY PROTEIN: alanine aminotransferase 1 [Pholidichthys leucotaenia]